MAGHFDMYVLSKYFFLDLKWFQVNSADEALKVMKIGRKNQSFSSTKLNNISSRRYFILNHFSIHF